MSAADRAAWREHPNVAGPASMLLFIHDQFRAASERLRALVANGVEAATLARHFRPLAEVLHHHHHAEEAMLFPAVLAVTGDAPVRLVEDHVELTRAIDELEASLAGTSTPERIAAAVATFDDVLVTHLEREEALVLPVLLAMTPAEAQQMLHGAPP
jgi:hemerythrin-like domain-containing protein